MRDPATLSFIPRAKAIYGSKYDYSRSINKGFDTTRPISTNLRITTQARSWLWMPKCGALRRASKQRAVAGQKFIRRAHTRYGKSYDYSKDG